MQDRISRKGDLNLLSEAGHTRVNFVPFSIGKYDFVELLGRGGMAEVYRVRVSGDQGFVKEFAFKRVLPGFLAEASVVALFEREARLTSLLNHPNIVQVFDFVKAGESQFLVMELVQGKNLSDALRRCARQNICIPPTIAAAILLEVAHGLEYAHNKTDSEGRPLHIIHRDISPHNIMISFEGAVKIVDFGIAKATSHETNTRAGIAWGKTVYMSPERAFGHPLDPRSDIFSACLVLYEMLTGLKIAPEGNEIDTLTKIQNFKVSEIEKNLKSLPPKLAYVLTRGLTPELGQRTQSAGELARQLQDFRRGAKTPDGPREIASWLKKLFLEITASGNTENDVLPFSVFEEKLLREGFPLIEEVLRENLSLTEPEKKSKFEALSQFFQKNELWIMLLLFSFISWWVVTSNWGWIYRMLLSTNILHKFL